MGRKHTVLQIELYLTVWYILCRMASMMASQVPVWQRSVPAVLSPLLPAMPLSDNVLADLRAVYEYKVMH